jgi:hypothetical protein
LTYSSPGDTVLSTNAFGQLVPATVTVKKSYGACDNEVRYCLYGPEAGHEIPSYFPGAAMEWFASF